MHHVNTLGCDVSLFCTRAQVLAGFKVKVPHNCLETELAKLFETTLQPISETCVERCC
jgi:hypothetical protein